MPRDKGLPVILLNIIILVGYDFWLITKMESQKDASSVQYLVVAGGFVISTLLQKQCNKKQETEKCDLKLCGYIYHQGTYTSLWGAKIIYV